MMGARIVVLFLFISYVFCDKCYWNSRYPYTYFGAKTPYDAVRGDIRDVPGIKGCEPVSVWALIRHGTRHPSKYDIPAMKHAVTLKDTIIKNYDEGRGEMCAQDIENLRNWSWNESMDNTIAYLTKEGHQEIFQMGSRFLEKFPELLRECLESNNYLIRPTNEQRTIESAKAFSQGFEKENLKFNITDPLKKDDIIKPYKHCDRYSEVKNNPRIDNEKNNYYGTREFKQTLAHVQKRIGLNSTVSAEELVGFYNLCRFYRAYSTTYKDPWCALFTNEDLRIIEYVEDIIHYYKNSYGGGPLNHALAAPSLKDLYLNFDRVVNGSNKSFTAYFSHDTLLEMVYTALGLFKDYPEIAGFERMHGRKWRASFITPFAANFIAVLHRCPESDTESHKVQFYVNEVEIHLCKARTCSWAEFSTKFKEYVDINVDFCKTSQ